MRRHAGMATTGQGVRRGLALVNRVMVGRKPWWAMTVSHPGEKEGEYQPMHGDSRVMAGGCGDNQFTPSLSVNLHHMDPAINLLFMRVTHDARPSRPRDGGEGTSTGNSLAPQPSRICPNN